MPKIVTDAVRAAEADTLAAQLADAVKVARASGTAEDWAKVATFAGNVQRRARLLAGLGRGG
jgi:hypothetical protein